MNERWLQMTSSPLTKFSATTRVQSAMALLKTFMDHAEIAAFSGSRSPVGLARILSRTVISTYGRDFAVASTLYSRASAPGKIGRQMQTWVRFTEGWHVVAAHVSMIDAP